MTQSHFCVVCLIVSEVAAFLQCCSAAIMQPRCSHENPSVRLSVKRVNYDKTKESSAQIFIPYEITFILVFRYEEWLVGDYWNFEPKFSSKNADLQSVFARMASAVAEHLAKKVKSAQRFPKSLSWIWGATSSPRGEKRGKGNEGKGRKGWENTPK